MSKYKKGNERRVVSDPSIAHAQPSSTASRLMLPLHAVSDIVKALASLYACQSGILYNVATSVE